MKLNKQVWNKLKNEQLCERCRRLLLWLESENKSQMALNKSVLNTHTRTYLQTELTYSIRVSQD